jgi:large subunit ribosomal protein L30
MSSLKITLIKSTSGSLSKHKLTVKALGLQKVSQTVVKQDIPSTRGMIKIVEHLVKVEEQA